MKIGIYLFSLPGKEDEEALSSFVERATPKVDAERRRKAEKRRSLHGKAESLGVGIILQWMAERQTKLRDGMVEVSSRDAVHMANSAGACEKIPQVVPATASVRISVRGTMEDHVTTSVESRAKATGELTMTVHSVSSLLDALTSPSPISLTYSYGRMGKPDVEEIDFCFNFSHSGDYILLAISDVPVGVDIQENRQVDVEKLGSRFFGERWERRSECFPGDTAQDAFFQLWTRAEAFVKLRGISVVGGFSMEESKDVIWIPLQAPLGFSAAVCMENNRS